MKAGDLQPCALCGNGMMHEKSLTFFRVTVIREVVDVSSIRRIVAMEMLFNGNAAIARAFAGDEISKELDRHELLVCEPCSLRADEAVYRMFWKPDEGPSERAEG